MEDKQLKVENLAREQWCKNPEDFESIKKIFSENGFRVSNKQIKLFAQQWRQESKNFETWPKITIPDIYEKEAFSNPFMWEGMNGEKN